MAYGFGIYPFESTVLLSFLLPFILLLINKKLGLFYLILSLPILKKLMYYVADGGASIIFYGSFALGIGFIIYDNIIQGVKIRFSLSKLDVLLILFTIYCFVSLSLFGASDYGYAKYFVFFTSILTIYILINYIKSEQDIRYFFYAIYLFGIVLLIYSLLKISDLQLYYSVTYRGRFTVLDINPIWIARYFSFSLFIGVYKIIKLSNDFISNLGKILILIIISIFQFYFILISASRGPLLSIIIALFVSFLINKRIKFKYILYVLLFAIFLIVIILTVTPPDFLDRILGRNTLSQNTMLVRIFANYEALRLFIQNPIFGIGFGNFTFGGGIFTVLIYPHNIFSEIMSETGVIGLILFLGIIITTFTYLKRINKKLDASIYNQLFGLFIASFINANLSGHIGANVYLFITIGLIYASYLFAIKYNKT